VIRRIAKFAGFCGGRRRARQEPQVWLTAAVCAAVLSLLHIGAIKAVSR
jgi:hypothetical protein